MANGNAMPAMFFVMHELKDYKIMEKIKRFISNEFEKWELWLYLAVLPCGMLIAASFGYILGLIYK